MLQNTGVRSKWEMRCHRKTKFSWWIFSFTWRFYWRITILSFYISDAGEL